MEGEERREIRARQGGQRTNKWRMSKLAWRFFLFQKNSALAQGYRTRTGGAGKNRKTFSILERRPTMRKGVTQAGV